MDADLLGVAYLVCQDMSNFYAQYKSIKPFIQKKDGQCVPCPFLMFPHPAHQKQVTNSRILPDDPARMV